MADVEEIYQVTYSGNDEEAKKTFDELNLILIRISEKLAEIQTLAEA